MIRRILTRITLALTAALSLAFTPLAAQDFNTGLDAYNSGDYAAALREWRPLAEKGNAVAQTELGWMYQNGLSVPQDNILAHMWYNIGAANGRELGGRNRDSIADGMTRKAIEQAQAMGRECMTSNYQKCGY